MPSRSLRRAVAIAVLLIVVVVLLVIALIMGLIVFLGGGQQAQQAQTASWCTPAQVGALAGDGIAVPAAPRARIRNRSALRGRALSLTAVNLKTPLR